MTANGVDESNECIVLVLLDGERLREAGDLRCLRDGLHVPLVKGRGRRRELVDGLVVGHQ